MLNKLSTKEITRGMEADLFTSYEVHVWIFSTLGDVQETETPYLNLPYIASVVRLNF